MLTGLLFAVREADDRSGLVSVLPFGGATLIEAQMRLLLGIGATQIVVIAPTLTADLMSALGRIGRRGQSVELVRSIAEVTGTLHPLARVLMLADGLVASEATVVAVANERHQTLLVTPDAGLKSSFERVGGGMAWAGVASLDPERFQEAAALPADYDPQSTLLRLAVASGAAHVPLPAPALEAGHGIELEAGAVQARGRRIVIAGIGTQPGWFNAVIVAPAARVMTPLFARSAAPGSIMLTGGVIASALGVAGIAMTWVKLGLATTMVAVVGIAIAAALARAQGESRRVRLVRRILDGVAASTVLSIGLSQVRAGHEASGLILGCSLILIAALAQHATGEPASWWGSAPAYVLVLVCCGLLGLPFTGLVIATIYAALTAAAGIEVLRTRLVSP